jgi:hypothetical protein
MALVQLSVIEQLDPVRAVVAVARVGFVCEADLNIGVVASTMELVT